MAGTFFVRTSGNDAADGLTPTTAFRTIGRAAGAILNAGDKVIVGSGTYEEGNITPSRSGIEGRDIQFLADDSGASTGDAPGMVIVAPPPDQTTGFDILSRAHVVIDGFSIEGAADAGIQVGAAPGQSNSSDIVIRNVTVIGSAKRGIDVAAVGAISVHGCRIESNGSSGIVISGCLSAATHCNPDEPAAVVPEVDNNTIGTNGAHGVFVKGANDGIIQNNVVFSHVATGITVQGSSAMIVANNLVYATRGDGIAVGTGGGSDDACVDTAVFNNTTYANGGWGLLVAPGVSGTTVLNNIIQGNQSGGLSATGTAGCGYVAGYNLVVDNVPTDYASGTRRNSYDRHLDPLFVNPAGADGELGGDHFADDDFHLQQPLGGQQVKSPAVDSGSATVTALGMTGATALRNFADRGVVDLGFHYDASGTQTIRVTMPYMPLFVRTSGSDANDGLDPQRAFATIGAAALQAVAGATVVVGPGRYREGNISVKNLSGPVTFQADPTGMLTGDPPGVVLVDAGASPDGCSGPCQAQENAFVVLNSCGVVTIDGFHVTGSTTAGIQIRAGADGARVRDNVVFSNQQRGIEILGAQAGEISNNLVYANGTGGIHVSQSENSVIENNTVYGNGAVGILVGSSSATDAAPGTSVLRNVVADNQEGIQTYTNSLQGYVTGFNVVSGGVPFAGGTPRAPSDFIASPLLENPAGADGILAGGGFLDDDFHLQQLESTVSPAVDIDSSSAGMLASGTTRRDGLPDLGPADAGYHYPFLPLSFQARSIDEVVFVRQGGDDANSGVSPDHALATVHKALAALAGARLVIIGPGRYSEPQLWVGLDTGEGDFPVLLGDERGTLTGDPAGPVVIDAKGGSAPTLVTPALVDALTFTGSNGSGLRILPGARGSLIRNNVVCGNVGGGVRLYTDGIGLVNNLLVENGRTGLNVRMRRATQAMSIINNTIAGNTGFGVLVREGTLEGSHSLLLNNIVSGNRLGGIGVRVTRHQPPFAAYNLNTDGYLWPSASGIGDLNAAPGFLGGDAAPMIGCPSAAVFSLVPGSPAVDAGVSTAIEIGIGARSSVIGVPDTGSTDLGYHEQALGVLPSAATPAAP